MNDTRFLSVVLADGEREIEVYLGTPLWDATIVWATFHGIDVTRVPAGSRVVRDAAGRRIVHEEFLEARDGSPIVVRTDGGWEVATGFHHAQGETPPLPLPCPGNDPACPCPDGDLCHYEGPDAWERQ